MDEPAPAPKKGVVERINDVAYLVFLLVAMVYFSLAIVKLWRIRRHTGSWDDDPTLN